LVTDSPKNKSCKYVSALLIMKVLAKLKYLELTAPSISPERGRKSPSYPPRRGEKLMRLSKRLE
jgi:hypothetical protein